VDLEECTSKKRSIMASPPYAGEVGAVRADPSIPDEHLAVGAGEDAAYVAMPKASSLRERVFLYLRRAGYDIKLVNITGFTRAMSQVKWSTGNASGSTAVDLSKGPAADLLRLAVMDLRSFYAIEPLLSFLKETFYGGGLGSLASKSDLIHQDNGTHYGCYKGKRVICDIRERTLGTSYPKWKEPIHDK
jgi:hypothetical protein